MATCVQRRFAKPLIRSTNAFVFDLDVLHPLTKTRGVLKSFHDTMYIVTTRKFSYERYLDNGGSTMVPSRNYVSNLGQMEKYWALQDITNMHSQVYIFDPYLSSDVDFKNAHVFRINNIKELIS